jgi:type II secretory pathway component PulF
MPLYQYKATQGGQRSQGQVQATNERQALLALTQRGLSVYQIQALDGAQTQSKGLTGIGRTKTRIRPDEVLQCIQELSTLLNAGIPLADATLNIAKGHEGRPLGTALNKTYNSLRTGSSLANALDGSGLNLPDYVHELVGAGEETGQLGASLISAATQMEADARFRRETRNALTYPMVLVASGLLATLVVFIFVVPKFANILSNPKADIPAMSRWVLHAGLWLVNNQILAALVFTGLVAGVWALLSNPRVRAQLWESASGMPVIGRWTEHIELARWASMFAVLLQHHVPLLDALQHSRNSLTGKNFRQKADFIYREVKTGQTLASAMQTHHFIEPMGINLIRVGEQSGRLAQTTASLAQMHRTHAEQSMKQFLVLLEPVTIMLVSVVLGGIMISVMLAITSLTNVI